MFGLKWNRNGFGMSELMTYQTYDDVWHVGYLATDVHKGGY